ncbi:mid1-interacting protein 1-B-like [Hemicordylus capensis]|uniref:mid1-interacting protein 1-B-like n=1 Tax=Hemicordylus capensis TaxID=884348 RepID=UPI002302020F|nr:mid1-interacting protein 1-B-like [Hemicordylus capensis]
MEGCFSAAVQKMEQMVMFPSLLQGVSLEEQGGDTSEADSADKDLYEYYVLLKSIRQMVEGGLVPLDSRKPQTATRLKGQEGKEEDDLEGLFYHHVSALTSVLNQLTRRANTVTSKYDEIMRHFNQSRITLRW